MEEHVQERIDICKHLSRIKGYLICVVGRAFGEAVVHCVVAEEGERPIITQKALSLTATAIKPVLSGH